MPRIRWRAGLPYLAFAIVALGVLNFIWFMAETAPLNLIPSNGRVVDGHYLLWSKSRGGLVDVGEATYQWLRLHETIFFLSWPLVMIAGGSLVFRVFGGRIAGDAGPAADAERAAAVRASGPPKVSARMAGSIGTIWFSRPLLRVDVHPGGIVVKPALLPERAILASEILAATPGGGLAPSSSPPSGPTLGLAVREISPARRPRGPFLSVDHVGLGMASPLRLEGGRWDIAEAVRSIAPSVRQPDAALKLAPPSGRELNIGRWDGLPPIVVAGWLVLAVIVTVSLVLFGLTVVIPQTGAFGIVWTAGLIAIGAYNLRRYVFGRRR